jgi:hypothetical protein
VLLLAVCASSLVAAVQNPDNAEALPFVVVSLHATVTVTGGNVVHKSAVCPSGFSLLLPASITGSGDKRPVAGAYLQSRWPMATNNSQVRLQRVSDLEEARRLDFANPLGVAFDRTVLMDVVASPTGIGATFENFGLATGLGSFAARCSKGNLNDFQKSAVRVQVADVFRSIGSTQYRIASYQYSGPEPWNSPMSTSLNTATGDIRNCQWTGDGFPVLSQFDPATDRWQAEVAAPDGSSTTVASWDSGMMTPALDKFTFGDGSVGTRVPNSDIGLCGKTTNDFLARQVVVRRYLLADGKTERAVEFSRDQTWDPYATAKTASKVATGSTTPAVVGVPLGAPATGTWADYRFALGDWAGTGVQTPAWGTYASAAGQEFVYAAPSWTVAGLQHPRQASFPMELRDFAGQPDLAIGTWTGRSGPDGSPIDDFGVQATVDGSAQLQPMPLTALGGPPVAAGADWVKVFGYAGEVLVQGVGFGAVPPGPAAVPVADMTNPGSNQHDFVWHITDDPGDGTHTNPQDVHLRVDVGGAGYVSLLCDLTGSGQKWPVFFRDGDWYAVNPAGGFGDYTLPAYPFTHLGGTGAKPICGRWSDSGHDEIGIVAKGGPNGSSNVFHFDKLAGVVQDLNGDIEATTTTEVSHINYGDWSSSTTSYTDKDIPFVGHWTAPGRAGVPALDTQGVRRTGRTFHLDTDRTTDRGDIGFTDQTNAARGQVVIGDFNGDGVSDEANCAADGTWSVISGPPAPNNDDTSVRVTTVIDSFTFQPERLDGLAPTYRYLAG